MFHKLTTIIVFSFIFAVVSLKSVDAQTATPSPTPATKQKAKRTSGVKVSGGNTDNSQSQAEADKAKAEEEKRVAEEENRKKTQEAVAAREKEIRDEMEIRERELNAKREEEKRLADEKNEQLRIEKEQAEAENRRISEQAEAEKIKREEEKRLAQEEQQRKDAEIAKANELAEKERIEKERLETEAKRNKEIADKAEIDRIEKERIEKERIEKETAEKLKLRLALIETIAKKLKFLDAAKAVEFVPEEAQTAEQIEAVLMEATKKNPRLIKVLSFCDGEFLGELLTLDMTADDTFGTLLNELRYEFGINFLPDSEVLTLPIRVNVKGVPWNIVLRSQLNYLDLEARCSEFNTIAILKRSKLQTLQDNQRKNAPLLTEYIKLNYLQPVVGGQVNVAGRGSGGGNTLESLENALNKILKADGDNRGSISRIPGRNEFVITATAEQLDQMKEVIKRADRPSYQVIIYASIVTANEQKLRDVGGQFSAIGGTANLDLLGGLTGFAGNGNSSSGGGNTNNSGGNENVPGSLNPGGVRTLGNGFGNAPTGGSTIGVSNIFGTIQLSAQLSFLESRGVVKIDNRPSIIVIDGQTADLQIGRNVFVPIGATNNFGGGGGQLEVLNAGSTLNATPQVIEDGNGKPVAVNLNLRIESNEVDTTVVSNGVPSVIRRSTQTTLMLNTEQTAVVGGFSTDSETNSVTKTPGLGDVPIIGGLFRRKVKAKSSDRIYFAIRVIVVSQGEILTTIPMNIDTSPRLPNENNQFFNPYNQPVKQEVKKEEEKSTEDKKP